MQSVLYDSALEGHTLLQRFHVEERVARGGTAWIYKAFDSRDQRYVAVKVLFSKWSQEPRLRERFLRESRIQLELEHPNIARVLGVIEERGLLGMVLEWIDGGDLQDFISQAGTPVPLEQVAQLFPPIIDALGYAHSCGIVHRDLKPGNILMVSSANEGLFPKITDFGLAKFVEFEGSTRTGAKMGTPLYMAPEQWTDSKRVDHRADIYSLSVILYRLLTLGFPFRGSAAELFASVVSKPPIPPENLSEDLTQFILRGLEKKPEDRIASCEEFGQAFQRIVQSELKVSFKPASASDFSDDATFVEASPLGLEAWKGNQGRLNPSPLEAAPERVLENDTEPDRGHFRISSQMTEPFEDGELRRNPASSSMSKRENLYRLLFFCTLFLTMVLLVFLYLSFT